MNDKVQELLADWEIARQDGKQISAKDLCHDCPELLPQLEAGIEKLLTTSWLFETSDIVSPAPVLPQPKSKTEFLELVKKFGLVPDSEIEKVSADADVDTVAGDFRRAGLLTPYQSEVLLGYKDGPIKLDRYVVLDEIGEGGMGKVYKALHTSMNRNVAIKMLSTASISEQRKSRFRREIESVASLNHPNVVTAYDACEVDGQFIFAMELIDGDDLTEVIQSAGAMDFDSAAEVVQQVAGAAAAAHRKGIIHRDIKPSNVLLTAANGTAKLLDLGIARIQDEAKPDFTNATLQNSTDITGDGVPVGTIAFMSPEQAMSAKQADERSDIYSLGCTFYYLLTGKTPFPGDNAVEVIVAHRELPIEQVLESLDVPEYGRDILHRMMAKQPENRFSSMDEVAAAIEQKLSVGKPRKAETVSKAGSAKPMWLIVGSLLFATGIGAVAWYNMGSQRTGLDIVEQLEADTRENDLARWVLNNQGYVVARTEFGEQTFDTIEAIPDSPIDITEISLFEPPSDFSIQWLTGLPELRSLTLDGPMLSEGEAMALTALTKLDQLSLGSCELDQSALSSLPKISNLRTLTLNNISCETGSLEALQKLGQLTSLTINSMEFADDDFRILSKLANLELLDLEDTQVKTSPLDWAAKQSNLQHLDLSGTNITDEDLKGRPICEQLTFIAFESCRVGSVAAEYISRLPNVADVYVGNTEITDADLKVLVSLGSLETLDIQNTNVTAKGLASLKSLKRLDYLGLSGLDIGNDDLKPLLSMEIGSLDLSSTKISDDALKLLSRMNLEELNLAGCDVSDDAINDFADQNQACSVVVGEIVLE